MLSLCSLRSRNTTRVRLAACSRFARSRFARLLCSLRFGCRLARLCADLRSRFARACRLACLLCSPCRLLDPPFPLLLAPLIVSPAALPRFARVAPPVCSLRSLPRLLCSRFARQLACCSLHSPPRLRLALLATGCSACCSLFARRLPARSARPSHSPCPLRLLQRLISDGQGGQWTGSICGIDVTEA